MVRFISEFIIGGAFLIILLFCVGCASSQHSPNLKAGIAPPDLASDLRRTVMMLANDIGERNCYRPRNLERTASWIESELRSFGYTVRRESFQIDGDRFSCANQTVANLIAELPGTSHSDEIVIVGAHYDSRAAFPHWHDHASVLPDNKGTPGANDNGSGVAATLALAKMMANKPQARTVRFCLWVNEEPPFYQNRDADAMGSYVSARRSHECGEKISSALCFDAVGCYSAQPQSKRRRLAGPLPGILGLPENHDYVAFLTTHFHGALARRAAGIFSEHSSIKVRTLTLPYLAKKVAWSDDWSYTRFGIPAFCVTDTAFLRADHYHELTDTIDNMDFAPFAEVVTATRPVIEALASNLTL